MTTDADLARLRAVFERFVTEPAELDAVFGGAPILESISIDSLALVHLVSELEKEFSGRFDYLSIDDAFANIDALAAYLAGARGPTG